MPISTRLFVVHLFLFFGAFCRAHQRYAALQRLFFVHALVLFLGVFSPRPTQRYAALPTRLFCLWSSFSFWVLFRCFQRAYLLFMLVLFFLGAFPLRPTQRYAALQRAYCCSW